MTRWAAADYCDCCFGVAYVIVGVEEKLGQSTRGVRCDRCRMSCSPNVPCRVNDASPKRV